MRGFCYSAWNKFLTNASTAEITVLAVAPDSNAVRQTLDDDQAPERP
jgi:hypothetical protein